MERYFMFLDWKNQYCLNDYITQGNVQIQGNPNQNCNRTFHRNKENNPKIHMELQTAKAILRKRSKYGDIFGIKLYYKVIVIRTV